MFSVVRVGSLGSLEGLGRQGQKPLEEVTNEVREAVVDLPPKNPSNLRVSQDDRCCLLVLFDSLISAQVATYIEVHSNCQWGAWAWAAFCCAPAFSRSSAKASSKIRSQAMPAYRNGLWICELTMADVSFLCAALSTSPVYGTFLSTTGVDNFNLTVGLKSIIYGQIGQIAL